MYFGYISCAHDDLVEGEDYIGLNQTVTLMPGETSVTINGLLVDDNLMEELDEVFEIGMVLPQQELLTFAVNLIDYHQEIRIRDDDGLLRGTDFLRHSCHC